MRKLFTNQKIIPVLHKISKSLGNLEKNLPSSIYLFAAK